VMMFTPVTTTSLFASMEQCERAAEQARSWKEGMQAVKSAVCELAPLRPGPSR